MNQFVEKYGQILLPLITPYDANEEVDYGKYAELIEYLIQNDLCDSLIVTGTTGEASLLTFDERVRLMETAVRVSAGRSVLPRSACMTLCHWLTDIVTPFSASSALILRIIARYTSCSSKLIWPVLISSTLANTATSSISASST